MLVSPLPRSRLGAQSEQALHLRLPTEVKPRCVAVCPGRPQRSRDRSHPRQPSRSLANSATQPRSLNRRVSLMSMSSSLSHLRGAGGVASTRSNTGNDTDRLSDVSPKAPALGTPRSFFAVLVAACVLTAALAVLLMAPQGGTSDTRSLGQARVSDALLFCTCMICMHARVPCTADPMHIHAEQ